MEKMSQKYINKQGINEGRIVLHSDLNNFFASVECKHRPELVTFPVAVCGNKADRHGIVLAKNEIAAAPAGNAGAFDALTQCIKFCIGELHHGNNGEFNIIVTDAGDQFNLIDTDFITPACQ